MIPLHHLLPWLLLSAAVVGQEAEGARKSRSSDTPSRRAQRSTQERDREGRKAPSEKTPAANRKPASKEGASGTDARLKLLEAENLRLRQELAAKAGAAGQIAGAESTTPEGALAELKAGNLRFMAGTRTRSQMTFNDASLRRTLAQGQSPFAVIVTCSDSRLGENFIFDQELGRLFTIREAGNCPDLQGLASIEYAAEHLGSKLVVVLGHDSCGAVKAVMEAGPAMLPGNLWSLQSAMAGLLESVPHPSGQGASSRMQQLVKSNAERQARIVLNRSTIVQHLCDSGKLKVVPALYELESGRVEFLPPVGSGPARTEHP